MGICCGPLEFFCLGGQYYDLDHTNGSANEIISNSINAEIKNKLHENFFLKLPCLSQTLLLYTISHRALHKFISIPTNPKGKHRLQCLAKKLDFLAKPLIKWVYLAKDFEH